MARLTWLLGSTVLTLSALSAGCGGDDFKSAGGSGGQSTTTASGGTGGTGGATTGGTGGATTGGTGGATTGGTGGATGGTGGAPVCQPINEPCAECAYATCEAEYCACYAEDECAALVNCLSPCDPADTACQQPCLTDHKNFISQVFLLGDCAADQCSQQCSGIAKVGPCPKCLFTKCSVEMNECLADPACREIVDCATACPAGDIGCAFACTSGKPQDSVNKALNVQACAGNAQKCQADCGG